MNPDDAARRLRASSTLRRISAVADGAPLFLTGGSLRDRLLGVVTHDIDLVTTGDPRALATRLANALGGRPVRLGQDPRVTWRLATGVGHLDLVGAQGSLHEDVLRRDLTVNAMLWRLPHGPLLDLTRGLEDLAAGRLRTVRYVNLVDDPVRVLRAVRLAATRPQLRLTAETERQLAQAAPGLARAARERVVEELRLLLAGPAVERALLVAVRCRLLSPVLPTWEAFDGGTALARLAGRLAAIASSRDHLGSGAVEVATAVLGAPAAGFPDRWDIGAGARALVHAGHPERRARRVSQAAELGARLAPILGADVRASRGLAAEAGLLLPMSLAWAIACRDATETIAGEARALLRWWRRFAARPPLLTGSEVAELLDLAEGPARAAAIRRLHQARARGELRTASQARDFLTR